MMARDVGTTPGPPKLFKRPWQCKPTPYRRKEEEEKKKKRIGESVFCYEATKAPGSDLVKNHDQIPLGLTEKTFLRDNYFCEESKVDDFLSEA